MIHIKKFGYSFGVFFTFIVLFRFGAGLHYTLLSTLGERVFPIWLAGFIISAGSVLQMVSDVPAGLLLDKYGYVRLLKLSSLVFVLAGIILFFGLTPLTFVLTVILSTFGWLFNGPGVNAYILAEVPSASAGKIMGLQDVFSSLGIVLSTMLLPFVIGSSAQTIGLVTGFLLLLAAVVLFVVPKERSSVHAAVKIKHHHYYIRRHFIPNVLQALRRLNPASTILIIQSFAGSVFYGMIWFAIPLAIADGLAHGLPSISLGIFDFAVVILGALFGKLADRSHKHILVLVGLFVFSIAGILLGFNFNLWFLLLGFIATAGDELSSVSLWAWLDALDFNHAEDGLVNGAIIFFEDLGWAVGPALAGVLFSLIGPSGVIVTGASILFIAWLTAFIVLRHPRVRHTAHIPIISSAPHRSRHKR